MQHIVSWSSFLSFFITIALLLLQMFPENTKEHTLKMQSLFSICRHYNNDRLARRNTYVVLSYTCVE